jgi:hypothetical protein
VKHNKYTKVDYTTGLQQGDNMPSVLFLFIIKAFLETLQLDTQPIQFSHYPANKNGNLNTCNGKLQPKHLSKIIYI